MFGKSIRMRCGHIADTIMTDVPYSHNHDLKVDIATCSLCFDPLGIATQPACNMANKQETTMDFNPKIERDIKIPVLGAFAVLLTIIVLIASI